MRGVNVHNTDQGIGYYGKTCLSVYSTLQIVDTPPQLPAYFTIHCSTEKRDLSQRALVDFQTQQKQKVQPTKMAVKAR